MIPGSQTKDTENAFANLSAGTPRRHGELFRQQSPSSRSHKLENEDRHSGGSTKIAALGGEVPAQDVGRSQITRPCHNRIAADGERFESPTYVALWPPRNGKDIYDSGVSKRALWTGIIPLESARTECIG